MKGSNAGTLRGTRPVDSHLKAERIQSLLGRLPGWEASEGNAAVRRTYRLPDVTSALAFVQYVGTLARSSGQNPDLRLHANEVTVILAGPGAAGLTEADLELARLLDQR